MENSDDEYKNSRGGTNMFLQSEELDSYLDDSQSAYYDLKNIVNRRKKLNDRIYALRPAVPSITKMDKASIIKDAIEHIQSLHDEERRIQAEISELESGMSSNGATFDFDEEATAFYSKPKRTRTELSYDSAGSGSTPSPPIQVIELRVSNIGEKTIVVSLTCSKRRDTMVKLYEIFESLKLKIITANITAFSGRLLKTVFLEVDEEDTDVLRLKIEAAIAALNH